MTFRSLSRALSIHVHEAKKCVWRLLLEPRCIALSTATSVPSELAEYHFASRETSERAYATYLIVGETLRSLLRGVKEENEMDVDGQHPADIEDVMQTKVLLVSERDYEGACAFVSLSRATSYTATLESKGQFTRIQSTYVYSLSPSPMRVSGHTMHTSNSTLTNTRRQVLCARRRRHYVRSTLSSLWKLVYSLAG